MRVRCTESRRVGRASGALLVLACAWLIGCAGPGLEPPDQAGGNAGFEPDVMGPGRTDHDAAAPSEGPTPVVGPGSSQAGNASVPPTLDAGVVDESDLDAGVADDASVDDGGSAADGP